MVDMRFNSRTGIRSSEQDLAGNVDISLVMSERVVGSNSLSGGTSLGMMTGAAGAAVDARMLATLSTKDFAMSTALGMSVADCADGRRMLLTVFHNEHGL